MTHTEQSIEVVSGLDGSTQKITTTGREGENRYEENTKFFQGRGGFSRIDTIEHTAGDEDGAGSWNLKTYYDDAGRLVATDTTRHLPDSDYRFVTVYRYIHLTGEDGEVIPACLRIDYQHDAANDRWELRPKDRESGVKEPGNPDLVVADNVVPSMKDGTQSLVMRHMPEELRFHFMTEDSTRLLNPNPKARNSYEISCREAENHGALEEAVFVPDFYNEQMIKIGYDGSENRPRKDDSEGNESIVVRYSRNGFVLEKNISNVLRSDLDFAGVNEGVTPPSHARWSSPSLRVPATYPDLATMIGDSRRVNGNTTTERA